MELKCNYCYCVRTGGEKPVTAENNQPNSVLRGNVRLPVYVCMCVCTNTFLFVCCSVSLSPGRVKQILLQRGFKMHYPLKRQPSPRRAHFLPAFSLQCSTLATLFATGPAVCLCFPPSKRPCCSYLFNVRLAELHVLAERVDVLGRQERFLRRTVVRRCTGVPSLLVLLSADAAGCRHDAEHDASARADLQTGGRYQRSNFAD